MKNMKKIKFFPFIRMQNMLHQESFIGIIFGCFIAIFVLGQRLFPQLWQRFLAMGIVFLFCIIIAIILWIVDGNAKNTYIRFTTKNIIVGHNAVILKKRLRSVYNKITLMEYFYFPHEYAHVGNKKPYRGFLIDSQNSQLKEEMRYISVFIIYKEHLPNDCPWDEETDHVSFSQKTYDAFSQKIFNKDMILLDATFKNYQFLRQFYEKESFADSRAGGKDMLTEFENRLIENKNKKALKTK